MGVYTDQDLDELIRANLKLTQENNKMLRAMRRSVMYGRVFRALFWVVLLGGSYMVYYVFVAPYVAQVQQMYEQVQGTMGKMTAQASSTSSFRSWAADEVRQVFLK